MRKCHLLYTIICSCFCYAFSFAQSLEWARQMGSKSASVTDQGRSIAADANGFLYVTGTFGDTSDLDPGPGVNNHVSNGGADVFIEKLDQNGNQVWLRTFGSSGNEFAEKLALDAAGNVYITGWFSATVDFDPDTSIYNLTASGNSDPYVLKLDQSGNFVWAKAFTGAGHFDWAHSIAADSIGNIYVTGEFSDTADFDPGAGAYNLAAAGENDIFIVKLNTAGDLIWAKAIGGTEFDNGRDITLDHAQSLYLTGYFSATADLDPGTGAAIMTSQGAYDVFILKMDTAGNYIYGLNKLAEAIMSRDFL